MGVEVEFGAGWGIRIVGRGSGKAEWAAVVLVEVLEGCEERGPETVVDAGEVAGKGGLDLGLGEGVGSCGWLIRAPRDSARGGGERGGNIEEDYVSGGGGVEDMGHWRRGVYLWRVTEGRERGVMVGEGALLSVRCRHSLPRSVKPV